MSDARYPKRKRAQVSYALTTKDAQNDPDEDIGDDAGHSGGIVVVDDSDDDEEWHINKRAKMKADKLKRKEKKWAELKALLNVKTKPKPKPKEPKKEYFRFLDLFPEIRNEIYKLCLTNTHNQVKIESQSLTNQRIRRHLGEHDTWGMHFRNLRLLRTCKQVYAEGAGYVYSQTFKFQQLPALQTFLLIISPETMDKIKDVELFVANNEWKLMPGIAAKLPTFTNLTRLKISGLSLKHGMRDFVKYLDDTGRNINSFPDTIEAWDKLMGMKLARDTYPFMFPYYKHMLLSIDPADLIERELKGKELRDSEDGVSIELGDDVDDEYDDSIDDHEFANESEIADEGEGADKSEAAAKKDEDEIMLDFPGLGKMFEIVEFVLPDDRSTNNWASHLAGFGLWGWGWRGLKGSFDRFKRVDDSDERRQRRNIGMANEILHLFDMDTF